MHTSRTLNLGILAHVDAGKTSLTERLLFDTGAIDRLGSVDAGSTRTDSGELERRRGITIRTAVAPFRVGDLGVNLIDTPGHSDFIAEVGRALGVLDGAVLVLSAVEGVQAQTRVLMRTLRRLRLPTLVFVNKADRPGAREAGTLADIRRRLTPRVVPMATVHGIGTPAARAVPGSYRDPAFRDLVAEALAEDDDALLARLVDGPPPGAGELRAALADRTARGLLHPVYFGSALSGEGIAGLLDGIATYLPAVRAGAGAPDAGPTGTVFAVERGASGEKTAYLRLFSGELAERARITLHRREADGAPGEHTGRITFLETVGAPPDAARRLTAGGIARLRGLPGIRVGDRLGPLADAGPAHFAPPSLESVVRPVRPADAARLHAALAGLADQDPLIGTRALPGGGTSVLLYGEVQKEVLAATLDEEFGLGAAFEPSTTILRERPAGTGEAREEIDRHGGHVFWATVGLRVEPGAPGSGNVFRRDTELGALPLAFDRAVEETVHGTLDQGLRGWPVTDCVVTLTRSGFVGPVSTAADFRQLTPLVLMAALAEAGTEVYEPCHGYELEVPVDCLGPVMGALAAAGAVVGETVAGAEGCVLRGTIPARGLTGFEGRLPGLTRGEGVWWTAAAADRPCGGSVPKRPRSDGNPLNRAEYLRSVGRA
ncbi:GTP-binding protein [Streptomyces eurocidicus]|uniref:GTP-binding protein n=1 Tax=Streptomyces eurocidicus TaxID=66423 RepID=A0A2N8NUP1_STREU|nr:tetracycline resistance ribosomal protection protein Otr(A) [Streptomyces eurocidicus]MBB5121324.1 ribosomal protection tetracycline resistance protein [Streptomyces eurocidicus]MBF6055929.1 tetracycline resistance ribosomal protection protein Otr(A) [Streptomyces eurocidicus]PNE32486.1 GTP-binding protein [Streptomyces eurocidicus]